MPGFAVVDLETTGLDPRRGDRIVELAVVHVSPDGELTGQWETLVNPRRDLGPQRIHRVSAAQALRAPTFDLVAGELAELLAGRVTVAHNLHFDGRFLAAEYSRHGYRVPLGPHVGLCTMRLAAEYLPGAGRSLADCCAAVGIALVDAHHASADAFATAQLLSAYVRADPAGARWAEELTLASEHPWPHYYSPHYWPSGVTWLARELADAAEEHFMGRIAVTPFGSPLPGAQDAYLASLDRALLDRHISLAEADALVRIAEESGLGRRAVLDLHRAYLAQLADEDLAAVAELLGLAPDDVGRPAPGRAPVIDRFALARGDLVCFTGEMRQERPAWERRATDAGLAVHPAVTKRVKLLVAADPDTLSGKACRARDYGIPVVAEDAFAGMLDRGIGAGAGR
ncbi:exonuclease domain-containing protein [Amycolatopsis sp. H20-H5]|uniref:exonuclease domain-containing protein n=1 Tax=Amycolatopsis sp. H20-H5 TaxID=3046309 RepID=UPI002DBF9F6D|nr:exonuclease domain-containing protein [Amycolatopsis sp. H20-H5]MEC3977975.1 exonuclease domain-containing protein [Amycolatopsis sp. H20-H5]